MADTSPTTHRTTPKAEQTRSTLLRAAEEFFAEKGYAATRLEDVAARVGIRRASIFYYFRDKRELYDAVLDDIFGTLLERYRVALQSPVPLPQRVEGVIEAWVASVGQRPTIARLLLWEAADGSPERVSVAAGHGAAGIAAMSDAIREGQRQGLFKPIDPIHLISTIVGATVFLVAGAPRLVQGLTLNPLNPKQLDAHRIEMLETARRLLGMATASTRHAARGHRRRKVRGRA